MIFTFKLQMICTLMIIMSLVFSCGSLRTNKMRKEFNIKVEELNQLERHVILGINETEYPSSGTVVVVKDIERFIEADSVCVSPWRSDNVIKEPRLAFTTLNLDSQGVEFDIAYFMSFQSLKHTLKNKELKVVFEYGYKADRPLKDSLDSKRTNKIYLDMLIEDYKISNLNPRKDEILYGYVKMKTPEYYKGGDSPCKKSLLTSREFEYYFKFKNSLHPLATK